jgi:type IV secretory pathway VirB10-like protein
MNTFWLKIAGLAVLVVGVIILITVFTSGTDSEPKEPQKTVYDQWEEDDKRLRAEPRYKEPPTTAPLVQQTTPVAPPKPEFKKLNEIEEIQAQRLFEAAMTERKMGRLPGIRLGYKKMVEHCREIIRRWPDSKYAFDAKRLLADIPERYHKMYNITKEEIDLGNLK